jgi:hypothetical protein
MSATSNYILWNERCAENCDAKIVCQGGIVLCHHRIVDDNLTIEALIDPRDNRKSWCFLHPMKLIEQLVELLYLDRIQIVASEIPKFIELLLSLGIRLDCLSFEFEFGTQSWHTMERKYEIVMKGENYYYL